MRLGRGLLAAAAALLAVPAADAATRVQLMPGVTYTKQVRFGQAGPYVLHVITAPRPRAGSLYELKPVLSNGTVTGLETVSSMQRRSSRTATVVGVNGDLFSWATGAPSGIFLRDNVLVTRPFRQRATLSISTEGDLAINRVRLAGSWQFPSLLAHPLWDYNRPLRNANGVTLFSRAWGRRTPPAANSLEVVVGGLPRTRPNTTLSGTVVTRRRGGGTVIPRRGAVLHAKGTWRPRLRREARIGSAVSLLLRLNPWAAGRPNAIGGGPLIVRAGEPVLDAGEWFSASHLGLRHPRTAVGQRADGTLLLVAVDGRSRWSTGLKMWELALELTRLGALRAMSLDGGGSTTIAFNGRVLNRPSDGVERRVSDALLLYYYGVYAPRPRWAVFSPNGDGVADVQRLTAKVARPSRVVLSVLRPDGSVRWRYTASGVRGIFTKDLASRALAEGTWQWVAEGVDGRGRASRMTRTFTVNKTLGFLELSKRRMAVRKYRGGRLVASWRQTRAAETVVRVVRRSTGRVVRRYAVGVLAPGRYALVWDGRNGSGNVVTGGRYVVRVSARNVLGRVSLERGVLVVRVS